MPLAVLRSLTETQTAADPSVVTRTPGLNDTASLTHTVPKPAGSGGAGVVCFTNDVATVTATTASSGWAAIDTEQQGSTTNHRGSVFYTADLDAAATLVVDLSTAEQATWVAFRIADGGTPEVVSTNGSGTPYSFPALTPSGGSGNYLSILYVGTDSSTTTTQSIGFPSGWTNPQSQNPGVTSSAATFTADQLLTGVSTITPADFTMGAAEQWVCFNIAFPRGSGGGGSGGGGGATAPVIRSFSVGTEGALQNTVDVAAPAGLQQDDYLLALHCGDADNTLTSPLATLGSAAGDGSANIPPAKISGRIATSGDASASTFTFSSSFATGGASIILMAIQKGTFDPATPPVVATFTRQARTSTTLQTAPGLTGVVNGLLLGCFATEANGIAQSYPASGPADMTLVASKNSSDSYALAGMYSQVLTADGATGTRQVSPTPSSTMNGWSATQVLIAPAPVVDNPTEFFLSAA